MPKKTRSHTTDTYYKMMEMEEPVWVGSSEIYLQYNTIQIYIVQYPV